MNGDVIRDASDEVGTLDVAAIRAETPACLDVAHLNNAGAALPPQVVVDETIDFLRLESTIGGYESVDREADRLDRMYRAGARLLNCAADEIALTTNASEAWWRAFTSVRLEPGDRIVTGRAEYVSNAFGMMQANAAGIDVVIVDDDESGQIDLARVEAVLDERVKLVALTHVPTSSGLVNPAAEVGALAKTVGALYLLDACQSTGQIPLDVEALQCDFLSLTGRKWLRGPRGTGMLYVRSSVLDSLRPPSFIDGYSADWTGRHAYELQPGSKRFELFETSFAAKAGLGVAIDYALDIGIEAIEARVGALASSMRDQLDSIDGVEVLDRGRRLCGIVTFTVAGHDSLAVKAALGAAGVNVSGGALSAWQVDHDGTPPSIVRASPHYYNTDDEIARLVEVVSELRR